MELNPRVCGCVSLWVTWGVYTRGGMHVDDDKISHVPDVLSVLHIILALCWY